MPQFDVIFRGPDGARRRGTYEGDSVDAVRDGLQQNGFEPLGYAAQGPPAPTPEGQVGGAAAGKLLGPNATGGALSPDTKAGIGGTVGQIGLPVLAGALAPETGGGSLAALGLLGGLLGSAAGRRGLPTLGDVASTVAGEAVPPAARLAGQALRLPSMVGGKEATSLLSRGVSGAAEKAGVPLTAGQRFPTAVAEGMKTVPGELAARQESAAGQAILDTTRTALKSIPENPVQNARRLTIDVKTFVNGLDDVNRDALKRSLLDSSDKLNLDKLDAYKLRNLTAKEPLLVHGMFQDLARAGWKGSPEEATAKLWLTDAIHASTKTPLGVGQFRSGRAMFDLDGRTFADLWHGLNDVDHLAFGKVSKGLEHVVRVIDTFPVKDRARLPVNWFKTALHRNPLLPLAIGAIGVDELTGAHGLHGVEAHPIATGAILGLLGTQKGARFLFQRFLATDAGARWVAAGLAMQQRGLPELAIVEGLSRAQGRATQGGIPTPTTISPAPQLPQLGGRTAYAQ